MEKRNRRRRQKKRRTEDFSSDSSDSSSSESEQEQVSVNQNVVSVPETKKETEEPNIDALEIPKVQSDDTRIALNRLTLRQQPARDADSKSLQSLSQTLQDDKTVLNEYLRYITVQYANDLDNLRGKPDFKGEASLNLLVKLLKESGNVFDRDTLKAFH